MIKVVNELETDFRFDKSCPLNEYPRPQLRRDSFLNLNGIWQYKIFSDTNIFIPYANEFRNALTAASAGSILAFEVARQRFNKK